MKYSDYVADNFIPRQSAIDDVGSAAGPITVLSTDGEVEYVNAGGGYEDGNVTLWNRTTNTVDASGLPEYSKLDVVLNSTINVSSPNGVLRVRFECPRPAGDGGPFDIRTIEISPKRQGVDYDECIPCIGYAGSLVIQYGIKIYTSISDGSITISNRRLLVRA